MTDLDFNIFHPKNNTKNFLLFLHGLGADFFDFEFLSTTPEISKNWSLVLPNAPLMEISINLGFKTRAWHDIISIEKLQIDETSFFSSVDAIERLIHKISAKYNPEKIVIGGFSQGGAMAIWSGLTSKTSINGIVCFSGYLPLADKLITNNKQPTTLSIIVAHGSNDNVVPFFYGKKVESFLLDNGFNVKFYCFDMEHQVNPQQIEDLEIWLATI